MVAGKEEQKDSEEVVEIVEEEVKVEAIGPIHESTQTILQPLV